MVRVTYSILVCSLNDHWEIDLRYRQMGKGVAIASYRTGFDPEDKAVFTVMCQGFRATH